MIYRVHATIGHREGQLTAYLNGPAGSDVRALYHTFCTTYKIPDRRTGLLMELGVPVVGRLSEPQKLQVAEAYADRARTILRDIASRVDIPEFDGDVLGPDSPPALLFVAWLHAQPGWNLIGRGYITEIDLGTPRLP
jgi:cobalamin biosynthesis Mg chelatase CobN